MAFQEQLRRIVELRMRNHDLLLQMLYEQQVVKPFLPERSSLHYRILEAYLNQRKLAFRMLKYVII